MRGVAEPIALLSTVTPALQTLLDANPGSGLEWHTDWTIWPVQSLSEGLALGVGGAQNNTKPSFTCLEQCWTLREIHNLLLIMFSMVKSISISPNFCLSISFYALKPIHWLEVLTVGGRITVDSQGKRETHITRCNWMKLPFQTLRKYKLRRTVRGGWGFHSKKWTFLRV